MSNYLIINVTSSKKNIEKVETKIWDYYLKKTCYKIKYQIFFWYNILNKIY